MIIQVGDNKIDAVWNHTDARSDAVLKRIARGKLAETLTKYMPIRNRKEAKAAMKATEGGLDVLCYTDERAWGKLITSRKSKRWEALHRYHRIRDSSTGDR
jgi:hypothetical protein